MVFGRGYPRDCGMDVVISVTFVMSATDVTVESIGWIG